LIDQSIDIETMPRTMQNKKVTNRPKHTNKQPNTNHKDLLAPTVPNPNLGGGRNGGPKQGGYPEGASICLPMGTRRP
jgi:hypothetical protein